MLLSLVSGLLAVAMATAPADTTIPVQRDQRLAVSLHAGTITVRTWTRNAIRIRTADDDPQPRISMDGAVVTVSVSQRYGPAEADLELTVPAWVDLSLAGVNTDMRVDGSEAPIRIETVQGDVTVRGGRRQVSLQSVEGQVTLSDAEGHIEVNSVNDDVHVTGVSGTVDAQSVNGDVQLERIRSTAVSATTVNGDLTFDGALAAQGLYRFSNHNGDITLMLPASTAATFYVSTYQGDFDTDFPVTVTGVRRGKRYTFTLGAGSARVEAESFQGDVTLRRGSAGSDHR